MLTQLVNKNFDLPEYQAATPEQVAAAKVLTAVNLVKGPVIIEDVSLCCRSRRTSRSIHKWSLKSVGPMVYTRWSNHMRTILLMRCAYLHFTMVHIYIFLIISQNSTVHGTFIPVFLLTIYQLCLQYCIDTVLCRHSGERGWEERGRNSSRWIRDSEPRHVGTVRRSLFVGRVDGELVAPRGKGEFGFDPTFVPRGPANAAKTQLTFAEMSAETKNAVSHRSAALRLLQHPCRSAADVPIYSYSFLVLNILYSICSSLIATLQYRISLFNWQNCQIKDL